MKILTWIRKDWHLTEDAHDVLRFMSTQMNLVGASVVGALMYAGASNGWIALTLVAWVALAAFGAVIKQPELEE